MDDTSHIDPPQTRDVGQQMLVHTPEPWEVNPMLPFCVRHFGEDRNDPTQVVQVCVCKASEAMEHGNEHFANAARIAACVNGCKGINPDAVPELLEVVKRLQLAIGAHCCLNCITEEDLESEGSDLLAASKAADSVLAKATNG